ncbi:MAG: tandem-95 repeat protein [Pirellulales bacterium]
MSCESSASTEGRRDSVAVGTITNDDANHSPTAYDDVYEMSEEGALNVSSAAANRLGANDFDYDGDSLTYAIVGDVPEGLSLQANGSFSYTPPANFYGTTTFTYSVSDGRGGSDEAQVTIHVAPVNDAPQISVSAASYDAVESLELALHGTGLSVLDADGDSVSLELTLSVVHGTLTAVVGTSGVMVASGSGTGTLVLQGSVYQINTLLAGGYGGSLVYEYADTEAPLDDLLTLTVLEDGVSSPLSATSDVAIHVAPDPSRPTISLIADVTIDEDESSAPISFTIGDDSVAAADLLLTIESSDTAIIPTANVVLAGTGAERTLVITPAADHFGTVTITILVSDGERVGTRRFQVTVEPVNDLPSFAVEESAVVPLNIGTAELEEFVTGISVGALEEQTATFTITSDNPELFMSDGQPTIVVDPNTGLGTLRFKPQFAGSAEVTITLSDGVASIQKTFLIDVIPPSFSGGGGGTSPGGGSPSAMLPYYYAVAIARPEDIELEANHNRQFSGENKIEIGSNLPADTQVQVALRVSYGELGTSDDDEDKAGVRVFSGTVAQVNEQIQQLRYFAGDRVGTDKLSIRVTGPCARSRITADGAASRADFRRRRAGMGGD